MALIKCPQCEASISDKAHRCPKCGVILSPSNSPNQIVEPTRPVQVSNNSYEAVEEQPVYEYENQRRNLKWVWFVVGGVICVGLVAWLLLSQHTTPTHDTPSTEENLIYTETEEVEEVEEYVEEIPVPAESTAEEEVKADRCGQYILKGKVNDKYDVQIWLSFEGSTMSGKYCYTSTLERYGDQPSSYIEIHGVIDYDNNFTFTGTSTTSSSVTEWTGTFDDNRFYAKKKGKDEEMVAYVEHY